MPEARYSCLRLTFPDDLPTHCRIQRPSILTKADCFDVLITLRRWWGDGRVPLISVMSTGISRALKFLHAAVSVTVIIDIHDINPGDA
jgi:hypothetical protein